MKTSEQINELAGALAKAQAAMGHASKDSTNPHFKSKYADLAACIDAARGPLSAEGIAVVQGPSLTEAGQICLSTRLIHTSGQWIECDSVAMPKDLGPQSVGSVITYLRRYSYQAMAGLASDDDDGNAGQPAQGTGRAPQQTTQAQKDAIRDAFARAAEATSRDQALAALAHAAGGEVKNPAQVPPDRVAAVIRGLDDLAGLPA